MERKFKVGDMVKVGHPKCGYDLAKIENYSPHCYALRVVSRNHYFCASRLHADIVIFYYTYPLTNWVMEYADNALQRLKKRYAKQV
jgi:hypothetical protein